MTLRPAIVSTEAEQAALTAFQQALPLGVEDACHAALAASRAVERFGADPGRAVRAAGLVVSGAASAYGLDADGFCLCPDSQYRRHTCKHALQAMLLRQRGARP